MINLINTNAKKQYNYIRYNVDEMDVRTLRTLVNNYTLIHNPRKHGDRERKRRNAVNCVSKLVGKNNKFGKCYLDIAMSFDIETTTLVDQETAFMYIWQIGFCDNVIIGRTWLEFIQTLDLIKEAIQPLQNQRVTCWVANLGYEFQFMRKWLNITDSFLKEQRAPCYIEHDGWLVFQDALLLTNSNLSKLAKDYCNTQKCVGDLDYSVIRTCKDILNEEEISYCDNDVLILTEWHRHYYTEYIQKGFRPLTITAVLQRIIKESYEQSNSDIEDTKIQTIEEYNYSINYLYRGGYCHGNELFVSKQFTLDDKIASFDFTSSYPSIMALQKCFPTRWVYLPVVNLPTMLELGKTKCTYATYTFYGIDSTTEQTIESQHKCMELIKPILDNGRVRSAEKMTVALTNLDLDSYIDFYTWEKCEVTNAHVSERKFLEAYFVKPMLDKYKLKDINKKKGLPYAQEKALCNSAYGLTVKRCNDAITHYTNDGWETEDGKDYIEQLKDKPFSSYVGVWISACARRNLLKTVAQLRKVGKHVLYCDTDSIKILNHDATSQRVIDAYNRNIDKLITLACDRYDIEREYIVDLGMFDREYEQGITRLKYLGAKRYLVSYLKDGKEYHNQTVAGLPKNILFKHNDADYVYEHFEDNLTVNECKLLSKYNDNPITVEINGVKQFEQSNVALLPSDFTMSLDEKWVELYKQFQQDNRERRIL